MNKSRAQSATDLSTHDWPTDSDIYFFLWSCSLAVPVLAGWVYGFVVLCPGTPEGSTGSCSGFKASQKTGQQLKVSSDRLGEAGNRTCDPWFTRHRFIPYYTAASQQIYLGDNCIQNFHLGRYIVRYTVGSLIYLDARAEP